jgi:hypothetical protein
VDDVEIKLISKPEHLKKYAKDVSFQPIITYRNDGRTNQDSTFFYATVYGDQGEVVYADTVMQATAFFTVGQVLFKTLNLDSLGDFRFVAEVEIEDDQKADNDTMTALYSVVTGNDIKIVSLLEPNGSIAKGSPSLSPRVVIKNNGINNTASAKVSLNIESNQGVTTLADTILVNLDGFVTDTFSYTAISFGVIGDYYVEVVNHWGQEDEPGDNDTLRTSYIVRYGKDIGITEHIAPKDKDTFELNDLILPILQVRNYGIDTVKEIEVEVVISKLGVDLYKDTMELDFLGPNRANNFTSIESFEATDSGLYVMQSTILNTDDNLDNANLSTTFYVALREDVAVVSAVFPNENQQLTYKKLYKPSVTIKNSGIEDLTSISVNCLVTVDANEIYDKTKIIDLASGASLTVEFDSTLTYNKTSIAVARFEASVTGDQNTNNNVATLNFEFVKGLSVSSQFESSTLVYPNPFTELLSIESLDKIKTIRIVDVNGKLVYEYKYLNVNDYELKLDVPAGSYILELQYENKVERLPVVKSDK